MKIHKSVKLTEMDIHTAIIDYLIKKGIDPNPNDNRIFKELYNGKMKLSEPWTLMDVNWYEEVHK